MNMGPFGWYVSHDGVNASLSKKVLQKARDDAVAATCGDASFSDEALVAVADDFVNVDISEGSDALIDEDMTCDDGRTWMLTRSARCCWRNTRLYPSMSRLRF